MIANKLQQYLTDHHIPYEVVPHTRSATSSETARVAHVPGSKVVKSVVIHHELGYLLALVPSTHRVDLDTLQSVLDRRLGLAREEDVAELFDDCAIGAIPPLGAAYDVPVLIDESLVGSSDMYFEGGDHATLVHVSGRAFDELTQQARRARFSHPA